MTVINAIESPVRQSSDTFADAVAIPLEPLFRPDREIWQARLPRRLSRVERQFNASSTPDARRGYLFAKRCLDVLGSLVAIVLFLPVMLLAAAVIKFTDWGPVLYVHKRVGLGGTEFNCFKFRSMIVDAEKFQADLEGWNSHDDSRTFQDSQRSARDLDRPPHAALQRR